MEATTTRRGFWSDWAAFLRRLGLTEFVAWALEASGPWAFLGAQTLYFGSAFLYPWLSPRALEAVASLLEDEAESRAFVAYLRGEEVNS